MSRILPLPQEAISQIHSSKHIVSLQGVVPSLLENSLDAGSSKIEATIDFRRGSCTVEDNGNGIPSAEFLADGGLGKMYHTSKRVPTVEHESHGSTGTYLASLAALSLLSITSYHDHHAEHAKHATLSIHQGKVIERKVPAPSDHDAALPTSSATRVSVRDLFGNMPVRVKQRALVAATDADGEKAWQELKRGVVALLLAWHKPCSVRVRDLEKDSRTLNLAAKHPSIGADLTEKSLNQLAGIRTKFDLKDKLSVLFQSGLAPMESRNDWIPVSAASSTLSVKGAICLSPAPTKQCQFISIGIRPYVKTDNSDFYDAVNKVFSDSAFGAIDDDSEADDTEKDRRRLDRRYKHDGFTQRQLHGRKGVDRWPLFVLQVNFKHQMQRPNRPADDLNDSSLKAISEIMSATVRQWLEAHHFRPRKQKRRKYEKQSDPAIASRGQSPAASGHCQVSVGWPKPDPATPLTRRCATIESATTSKKRRALDRSGNLHNMDVNQASMPTHTTHTRADFNMWSRIKSGHHSFYNEVWDHKKPGTAPEGQRGSKVSPFEKPKAAFTLPPLEAGELSNAKRNDTETAGIPARRQLLDDSYNNVLHVQQASSEDFGSVDDLGLMAAVEGAEDASAARRDLRIQSDDYDAPCDREDVPNDLVTEWTDPVTRRTYNVNSRTGVVLPARPKPNIVSVGTTENNGTSTRQSAAINTSISSVGKPLMLSKRAPKASAAQHSQWLPGFLKEWNNPVFARQDEERIPVASVDGPGVDAADVATKRCTHDNSFEYFGEVGVPGAIKLSKEALADAKVIRQVDQKFILCKMMDTNGEMLVLVDQHAASERVILESLFDELCSPIAPIATRTQSKVKTAHLEKPLHFQISSAEHQFFKRHRLHFAEWGILYDLHERWEDMGSSQVRAPMLEHFIVVTALPPGIAERCTLSPRLLIELLRSEIWACSSKRTRKDGTKCTAPGADRGDGEVEHGWLHRIGSCPQGVLDMLNSRACRSAIMFNDELSVDQCVKLLADLSRCAFPFMCAHGRVSMVPLGQLTGEGVLSTIGLDVCELHNDNETETTYRQAFRRWRAPQNLDSDSIDHE